MPLCGPRSIPFGDRAPTGLVRLRGNDRYRGERMTAKRRLVPIGEVEMHIENLRRLGVEIGAVDIRADGVTVYPPANAPGTAYDRWKAKKDTDSDRAAHRP